MCDDPIFICGVPRSGTSLCAGLVSLAQGVFFGKTAAGNRNNPKGFFENVEYRNIILKPYLVQCGGDVRGQRRLPMRHPPYKSLRSDTEHLLGGQGWQGERWAFKDPKLALVWPAWAEAWPSAKWVVTRRPLEETVQSMQRASFMNAHQDKKRWSQYINRFIDFVDALCHDRGAFEFHPNLVINGDMNHVIDLQKYLGISIPYKAARQFIDPGIWNRK